MTHFVINWCVLRGRILPGVYATGRAWIAESALGWDWHGFQNGTPKATRFSAREVITQLDGKFTVSFGPLHYTKLPWIDFDLFGNGTDRLHYDW